MELIFGAGRIDRRVADVEDLLRDWREKEKDWGQAIFGASRGADYARSLPAK